MRAMPRATSGAAAVVAKGLSPPIAAKVADCIIRRETAQGYRTVADVALTGPAVSGRSRMPGCLLTNVPRNYS